MYLNDIPSGFELVLENDPALADMFYALPVMEREKVSCAGLHTAQEISSYIESLII